MRRAGLIAAGAIGAVAVAAVGLWLGLLRDTAEPVSVDEAVTSFRTETEPSSRISPIREGVYVYATVGYERTDALTGVTHRYPRRSTITVAAAPCGVSLVWRVLDGRSTAWVYCVGDDGWELRSQDERHTFFGRTEHTTYVCKDTPIRPLGRAAGYRWRVTCSTDGATETGVARIVERLRWSLRGGPSSTEVHVRKSTRFAGDIRGSSRHDVWFDQKSGLPVRMTMVSRTANDSAVGEVRYEEDVTLVLTSLTPRR